MCGALSPGQAAPHTQSPAISEQICLGMRLEAAGGGKLMPAHTAPSLTASELGYCRPGSVGGSKIAIERGSDDQAGLESSA